MWREWHEDRVSGLAAEVAFFGLLSVFPMLLALASALGSLERLVGREVARQAEEEILRAVRTVLGGDRGGDVVAAVEDLFAGTDGGVVTVGAVVAVWAASRGVAAVMRALDLVYDVEERRSYVAQRLVAVGLALGSAVVGAAMLGVIVLGPLLGTGREVADVLGVGEPFITMWDLLRWPTAILVLLAWAATVFHLAPNRRARWRREVPGAILSAVAWALASVGLRAYLEVAGAGNEVLGALGGSVVVIMWLYLLAIGLLVGGELNAELARRSGDDGPRPD
jgi:membrane protein